METTRSLVHVVRRASVEPQSGERPPLLLLLHGVGANERQMASLAPAFDSRFLVLSVRSPLVLGPDAFAWFHVSFTPQGPVIVEEEAAAGWERIARFTDDAVETYNADPARVYVAGFSQGGIMALAALLTAPEQFAGAVCMSGRLLPEVLPHAASHGRLDGKPVLMIHGADDPKLGVGLARWAREQLEGFPLSLTYRELPMTHAITPESLEIVTSWLGARLDGEVSG